MPFHPLPSKNKKAPRNTAPVDSDSESSLDERGNVKHLIDYEYDETSSQSLPSRKAKRVARQRIQKTLASEDASPKLSGRRRPCRVVEDEENEENEEEAKPARKVAAKPAPKATAAKSKTPTKSTAKSGRRSRKEESEEEEIESEVEETEEDETLYSDEDDEDYDEDDDEDYEGDEEEEITHKKGGKGTITLLELLNGAEEEDPRVPKKYNLKKEPANVRRFVELIQQEAEEEDNIDNDITYFKSLSGEKQAALMKVLEQKAAPVEVQVPLKFKILEKVAASPDLARIAMSKYNALMNIDPSSTEYYKASHWINGFTGLPLGVYKDLPVRLEDGPEACQAFMATVHKSMEEAIYGHDEAKLQIMQFVSSWIANPRAHGNVLSIHGPPGVGKTSLIKDGVAKALGRPFHFITLGGATDASFLDGHSYTYEGSTWGKIVDVLIQSKCMNPVIYFDELDKVSETPKGEEIMNMLIHITDGSQNDRFQDKYFTGINLDLSRCLFIFSHNDHNRVNPILRDRMYNVEVSGFDSKQKLIIAERYLVNAALQEVGLFEKVSLHADIIKHVIEHYTGGEKGVRELKRCIQTVVSKINLLRFFNNPKQVPFAIEGFQLPFTIKRNHIELFLKRKDAVDPSIAHLYC